MNWLNNFSQLPDKSFGGVLITDSSTCLLFGWSLSWSIVCEPLISSEIA